jgi:hypothetical protein
VKKLDYQSKERNPLHAPAALATTSESAGWIWTVPEMESIVLSPCFIATRTSLHE